MQRSRRIAVLAAACALTAVASATTFAVVATTASAASPSCTVPSSSTPTPVPSGSQVSCQITDSDVAQPANLSVMVKLARTDDNNDIVDWIVGWQSTCYDSSGGSLGYDSDRQAGNIGPASEGTELVQVGTADNAYKCTVTVGLTAVLTGSEGMSMELQYTSLAPSPSSSATPSPSTSASPPGLVKGYAGKCLDDAGNSRSKGAKAVIWSCSTKDHAEQWTLVGGQLRLNGLCLSSRGDATNGTAVILYTCNQSWGEIWAHQKNGSVANKEQDWALCLTDPKYAKKNGTQLILATCRNTANQHWSVP